MRTDRYESAHYLPFSDSALLVEFGNAISLDVNCKVMALNEAILNSDIQGVEELVPTYRSLLVRYNPLKTTYEQLAFRIKDLESIKKEIRAEKRGKRITIPATYGGKYGPDLKVVAQYHGLNEEQVIKLHYETEYRVYMIGFVAGFPYLGVVSPKIATPRLKTPRLKVPAGSVGIAEKQTGIYPCEAPGGWQIIGRTPLRLFNPILQPPSLLNHGDRVRFKPVLEEEFKIIEEVLSKGEYSPLSEE